MNAKKSLPQLKCRKKKNDTTCRKTAADGKKNETGDRWRPAQRVRVTNRGFQKECLRIPTDCPQSREKIMSNVAQICRLAKPVADNNKDRRLKYRSTED